MGRNPFKEASQIYLENYTVNLSKGSLDVVRRRLKILDKMVRKLYNENKLSTTYPKKFTVDDIYAIYRLLVETPGSNGKKREIVTVRKYLNDLNNLCRSFGNFSVETMYKRYPIAKRSHRKRLPVLTQEQMEFIAEKGLAVPDSDRRMIRAYGVVGIYLGGGTRTIEVQHAKACNVFLTGEATPYIYLDFVKGQDTYGEERPAALIPMFIPLVERYMALRETLLEEGDAESEHYVFCLDSFDMMSDKTIRLIRKIVEEDTGIRFDGRMCRRTYAQYWKDQGVPIEAVSRNLGHASTKTTETFYGRIRQMDAVDLMKVKDSKN